MRLLLVSFLLHIMASLAFGQNSVPQHIQSTVFRITATYPDQELDTTRYIYNEYFREDGTDCTAEVLGYMRDPGVVKHDERGNVKERSLFWSNGEFQSRHVYTYDGQNRMIESRMEDEHSNLITRDEIEYNESGSRIRTEKFDEEGKSIIKTSYQYDTAAHQILYAEYKKGKLDSRYTHTYDSHDQLIKKEWRNEYDLCYSWCIFGYVALDELLYECTFDIDNNLTHKKEYLYTFDAHGSWIEKREYENDRLTRIILREIRYYE